MVRKHNYAAQKAAHADGRPVYPLKCRIRAEAGSTRVDIYDDIDSDGGGLFGGISAKAFADQLAGIKGAISLHVNSCGGDVWDGLAIFNSVRGHQGPVTVTVDGLAASIASVIVQGGQTRVMEPGSMLMVHDAFAVAIGNAAELSKTAQTLDQVSDNLAGVYAARAGGTQQQWRSAMRDETWYTADEAVAAGLADRVGERAAVLPDRVDLAALGVVPGKIAARLREMPSPAEIRGALRAAVTAAGLTPPEGQDASQQHEHLIGQVVHTHSHPHDDDHQHIGTHELRTPWGITQYPNSWPDPLDDPSYHPDQVRKADTHYRRDAIGAALDSFAWARSWGSFLNAVGDKDDRQGARTAISRVREARARNATLSERIPSEGGFLVPERLRAQVLTYMTDAIIRPRAQYIPMDSLRVPVPLLDNPSQANGAQALGGMTFAIVAGGATIPASVPDFGRVALEARKFAGFLASVPNELVSDATPFTDVFLPKTIAAGFAWAEDDLYISGGTGVGQPQALIHAPAALAVTRNTSSEVVLVDIVNMLKKLHPASKKRATWVVADEVFGQLTDMYINFGSATSGITPPPEWLRFDPQTGSWRLLGLEIVPHDHLPALGSPGDVMLVDLDQYLVGDRGEMTVERSQQGSGFPTNTSNFRIRARIDGRFWPQTTYTTAAGQVVSPLVILN